MKKIIQFVILIILILLIIFFYFNYLDQNKKINKKDSNLKVEKQIPEENNNLIKNLRYDVNFADNTKYSISSDLSELIYENNVEKVKMQYVTAIITDKNNTPLKITSDQAVYDSSNYDSLFDTNVKIEYLDHIIQSEKLDLNFNKNFIKIYDNVVYEGLYGIIETDIITIDLTTRNIDIYMKNSKEKVQIMSN
jgi:lipopolysaccharide export system protein LptC